MNRKTSVYLALYGAALISIALLLRQLAPDLERSMLATALVGGALCLLWALFARLGHRRRIGPAVTLIPVILMFIGYTMNAWTERGDGLVHGLLVPLLITAVFLGSGAMLAYLLHFGGGNPAPAEPVATHLPAEIRGRAKPGNPTGQRV